MDKNLRLFSPGPTPISKESLSIMATPPLHHRSEEFKKIIKQTLENLKILFDEEYLAVFTSTGTGALEASVTNFLSQDDFVISLNGGKFGARWSEIFKAFNINHCVYNFEWGDAPDLETIEDLLKKEEPQALFMQACETSTATMYNVSLISNLIQKYSPETLLIVDGVTAVGAYKLSMKANNIDVLITGSQKALGLPVGLSVVGFSKKARVKAEKSDIPKYYFNILKEASNLSKNQTWFSTPTQLWTALNMELNKLKNTGLEKKFELNLSLQKQVLEWAKENNISLFSTNPSPSLTALVMPEGISALSVQKKLMNKDYYIATGQEEVKDKIIRIGHMANISKNDMTAFLDTLTQVLKEEKLK